MVATTSNGWAIPGDSKGLILQQSHQGSHLRWLHAVGNLKPWLEMRDAVDKASPDVKF